MQHLISLGHTLYPIWLGRTARGYVLHVGSEQSSVALENGAVLQFNDTLTPVTVVADGDHIHVHMDGAAYELVVLDPIDFHSTDTDSEIHNSVCAPMPGSVIATPVKAGDAVAEGDTLMVIESMKLETAIKAPRKAMVETVTFSVGQSFERDAVLITLAAPGD